MVTEATKHMFCATEDGRGEIMLTVPASLGEVLQDEEVEVMGTDLLPGCFDRSHYLLRQRATISIAEDDAVSPCLICFLNGAPGIFWVCLISIEEVLGIKEGHQSL